MPRSRKSQTSNEPPQSQPNKSGSPPNKTRKKKIPLPKELDDLEYGICKMYVEGYGLKEIWKWVREELDQRGFPDVPYSYKKVRRAIFNMNRRAYLLLFPPMEEYMQKRLADRFDLPEDRIHVVNVRGDGALEAVTNKAGDITFDLIGKVGRAKAVANGTSDANDKELPEVHLGVGAGWTSRGIGKRLGRRLKTAYDLRSDVSKLILHGMSPGFLPKEPHVSPEGTFELLKESIVPSESIALLSHPVAKDSFDFDKIKQSHGVKESFEERDKIDLAISSLGSRTSEAGLWTRYASIEQNVIDELENYGWVGDFQFRPFSKEGPITNEVGLRAVTLFEISDFVRLAGQANHYVVLTCGPGKSDALSPMLTEATLKVWSHLVIDIQTAEELMTLSNFGGGQTKPRPPR